MALEEKLRTGTQCISSTALKSNSWTATPPCCTPTEGDALLHICHSLFLPFSLIGNSVKNALNRRCPFSDPFQIDLLLKKSKNYLNTNQAEFRGIYAISATRNFA
jgi:hypothetical protein